MCRISYLKEASLRLSVFCIAVTREIVTLHVGGWRCSPDIKQATFLKPESVSAEISILFLTMSLSPVSLLALLSCLVASSLASPRPRPEAHYDSYYDYYRPYYGYYR